MEKYDVLIIDEGQDFLPYWIDLLSHYLDENSSFIWFEDENQTIARGEYRKSGFKKLPDDIKEAIGMLYPKQITNMVNCRSTKSIDKFIATFFNKYCEIMRSETFTYKHLEKGNIQGDKPLINFYKNGDLLKIIEERLNAILTDGNISIQDIAIISCIPNEDEEEVSALKSLLLKKSSHQEPYDYCISAIGNHQLKRFTGEYDKISRRKIYGDSNGILCESISKLKGLEFAMALLIDVERPEQFQNHQHAWVQSLYCAFTRAKLNLEIFVNEDGNMNELFHAVNKCL
jgi:superfamily I DNA and RNA helicase